jgi:transporter family-2 protein
MPLVAALFAFIAGVAGALQITINGAFGRRVGVLEAGGFVGIITMLLMLTVLFLARPGLAGLNRAAHASPWLWLGGVMSAVLVLGVTYCVPRLGALATVGLIIAGQMVGTVVLDSAGWLGLDRVPFTPTRALAVVLIGVGAYLILLR